MYDVCVGLGYHCESTYQLRRVTGVERAHFFDWLDLDLVAVRETVAADFANVLRPGLCEPFSDGACVRDRGSNIRFFHDFRAPEGAPLTSAIIAEQFDAVRSKFDHLAARWRALTASRSRVLYVHQDAFDESGAPDLAALHSLLRTRYPAHDFDLLWLRRTPPTDAAALPPGVLWGTVPLDPGRWEGDDAAWDAALAPLDIPRAPGADRRA
ncbi:papain-like cysteine peptidase [Streptomyces sp. NPDC087897]|uniref:papain-like cysteine peptidase n=1 Tax=Streptomyces sp. NPDC087897 TaxID=3365817 RepID=UPI00381DB708